MHWKVLHAVCLVGSERKKIFKTQSLQQEHTVFTSQKLLPILKVSKQLGSKRDFQLSAFHYRL